TGAIVLFIAGVVAGNYAWRIDDPLLAALADQFAIATIEGISRTWTPAEQNTRWIGFSAVLVWSRLALVALSASALWLVHRRFRFAHDDGRTGRRGATSDASPDAQRPGLPTGIRAGGAA